jgi:nitrogen fixation/metabolism regulation signal transduction histidine kinase
VSLRRKFVAYLLFVHLVFAAAVIYFLWDRRIWLVSVEAFFIISFAVALKIFRELFRPLELIVSGSEFLRDGDFTTRLRELGQPEMDTLIGVYNEMVDHLRAERVRIQEQHFFLERILSVSPSAIITLDYDERISFANPAAETLIQSALPELKGKRLQDLHSTFAGTLNGLSIGQSAIVPLRGVRKVMCHKSQFVDQGHPRTFYLFDEMTEELRKTEKAAYEKLIRMLSHEVNNSLGAASSLLHSCLHYKDQLRQEDREDFETALAVAIARSEHLSSFMKSFADIVKLPLPQRRLADLRSILKNLVSLLEGEITNRNVVVKWDIPTAMEPVLLDEHQMEQVFLNIFKNSLEAIGREGRITVRMGETGRRAFVTIEDSGCGFSEEIHRHLFTPFFSTKENGQGIGLTFVQEVLAQHNFEFTLESTPGQPTRFTIIF